MANKNVDGDVNVSFNEAASRQSLESGESVKTLFGKLRKWLSDLKPVAFSGSYNDLSGKPTIPDVSSKVSKSGDTMTGNLRFNTVEFINDTDMFWVSSVSNVSKKPFYFDVADFEIAFMPKDDVTDGYLAIRHNTSTGGSKIGVDYVVGDDLIVPGLYFEGAGINNSSHVSINDNIYLRTEHLYLNSEEVFATTLRYDTPSQGLTDTERFNAINNLALPNAGSHNSIFRGKYLGSSFTSAQKSAIANGTFNDLFVGDYWTINGVNWRIADIDYLYGHANTHQLIIVPDTILYNATWNSTSTTDSGYAGSDIYTSGLSSALTSAQNAFGSSYIMEHTNLLTNAVSGGSPTGWADYTAKISLLNQTMLLGHRGASTAYGDFRNDGRNTVQLALFRLCPQYTRCTSWYWLSDVTQNAAAVAYASNLNVFGVTQSRGVRPYFCLKGE